MLQLLALWSVLSVTSPSTGTKLSHPRGWSHCIPWTSEMNQILDGGKAQKMNIILREFQCSLTDNLTAMLFYPGGVNWQFLLVNTSTGDGAFNCSWFVYIPTVLHQWVDI